MFNFLCSFFFNDTATTEIYTLSLHDALPISKQMIQMAQGYAIAKVNNAQGNAQRFILRLSAYQKAKAVTLQRLYLNDMSDILQNAEIGRAHV